MRALVRSLFSFMLMAFVLGPASAQDPEPVMHVYPQYIGATDGPEEQLGVVPTAFYVEVTGLLPETEYYFGPSGGAYGFLLDETTATRGSRWVEEEGTWSAPSTVGSAGTTDSEGRLARWLWIRPPSNFDHADAYRVRVRIFPFPDVEGGHSWDAEFPTLTALQIHESAPEGFEGAWVYGTVDAQFENHVMLAYENEDDERPLFSWMIHNHDIGQEDTRAHLDEDEFGTPGFFQLIVPANTSIARLEIRDLDNNIVGTQSGSAWASGDAGTAQNLNDQEAISLALDEMEGLPEQFTLRQNYPNPFNPVTRIEFELAQAGEVSLVVYNVVGQRVATLFDGMMNSGRYGFTWDGRNAQGAPLPSGSYIYQLRTAEIVESRTMTLIK